MKANNPLISVIVNCHNGEKYLKFCLQSIINQTYKNWELIFWDNFSSDKSKKIFKEFKDKRLKYFFSKNFYSLYKSRNLAIKKAKGEYISFLDADDTWKKYKLKTQINFMQKKNFQISYSDCYIFNEKKKTRLIYNKKKNYETSTQNLLNNYKLALLTAIIHKSFFKKKKFNNMYNIIGDFDYFIYLSFKNKLGYINKPLATYRVHSNNFSQESNLYFNELNYWLKYNKKKLKKNNLNFYSIYRILIKLKIKIILNSFRKFLGV